MKQNCMKDRMTPSFKRLPLSFLQDYLMRVRSRSSNNRKENYVQVHIA